MRFEDYTPNQQKAIVIKGCNTIVSAGAGSGKTQVLTQRVLHFVKNEGYKLENFLILTFTNLAAGEMKNRIRKALLSEGLEDANDVDSSDICTFDSYALSIVKKYHFNKNISKDLKIVDSNIISVKKREILDNLFEKLYSSNDDIFLKMIETYCFKDDKDIKDLVLDVYQKAILDINTEEFIDDFYNHYYNDKKIDFLFSLLEKKVNYIYNDLKKSIEKLPGIYLPKEKTSFKNAVYKVLQKSLESESFFDKVTSLPKSHGIRLIGASDEGKKSNEEFKKKLAKASEYFERIPHSKEEFNNYFLNQEVFIKKIIELVRDLDKEIMTYKNNYQAYEFSDIAKMALELIRDNPDIKEEIKSKLKMIMIDEYQDTSLLQETFINEIGNNNVYMVGDVKQSIYRFREARCDIFTNKYNKYKNHDGGVCIDLNTNFRSRKEVLEDINYIFKQIMKEEIGGANYKNDHMIEYGNMNYIKAGEVNHSNHSDILIYDKEKGINSLEIEPDLIARDIIDKIENGYLVYDQVDGKGFLRKCTYSDFCILVDRGTNFNNYVKIFNDYKLPLSVESDENISSNELVLILTNLLRLVKSIINNDYQSKDFVKSFLSVSRSFLFQYTDNDLYCLSQEKKYYNDKIIVNLRNLIDKYSYFSTYALFEKIIFEFDVYHKCILIGDVKKNEKYLDAFLEMFKSMSELNYSIDDFLVYMENIDSYDLKITVSNIDSNNNSIRLMNVHKSKGLEFNIIYFPGLKSKFNRKGLDHDFGISSEYGMILPPFDIDNVNLIRDFNRDYEIKEDLSEKIRLFYVALTRAREKMIFVLESDEAKKLLNNLYEEEFYDCLSLNKDLPIEKAINLYKKGLINEYVLDKILRLSDCKLNELFWKLPSYKKKKVYINEYLEGIHRDISNYNCSNHCTKKLQNVFRLYYNDNIEFNDLLEYLSFLNISIDNEKIKLIEKKIFNIDSLFELEKNLIINNENDFYNYLFSNKISNKKAMIYIQYFENEFPFDKEIRKILNYASIGEFDFEMLCKILSIIGYNLSSKSSIIVKEMCEKKLSEEQITMFFENDLDKILVPCDNLFNEYKPKEDFPMSRGLEKIYKLYQSNVISESLMNSLANTLGYELNNEFDKRTRLDEIFIDKGNEHIDINSSESFKDFLDKVYKYYKFDKYVIDNKLKHKNVKTHKICLENKLEIREINIDKQEVNITRASKRIDIDSKNSNLDFGTDLHFLMEVTDFKNPDYSIDYNNVIRKFISCDLVKNIENAEVYKEYVFFDEDNLTRGTIDLMLVYKDHIDIIDYKSSNIDDSEYDKQVMKYIDYIRKKFNKKTNGYLYSLLTGKYRLCK